MNNTELAKLYRDIDGQLFAAKNKQDEIIAKLYSRGILVDEIGKMIGRDAQTVSKTAHAMGCPPRLSKHRREQIAAAVKANKSKKYGWRRKLADEMGITPQNLGYHLKQLEVSA